MRATLVFVALIALVQGNPLKITGGKNAAAGQFPSNVAIYACSFGIFCDYYCGGTILNNEWILTAAHCFYDGRAHEHQAHDLKVIAGTHTLSGHNKTRQEIKAAKLVLHPDFKISGGRISLNDLGLLKLEKPLEYDDNVKAVKLPEEGSEPTQPATITGFGSTGGNVDRMADNLQYVDVPFVATDECRSIYEKKFPGQTFAIDEHSTVCTGPLTGTISACGGDSGSPMYNGDTLVGAVSWGYSGKPCGNAKTPVIYSKIGYFAKWIKDTIA